MKRFIAWSIDRWIILVSWYEDRRDMVATLRQTIEKIREDHKKEVERLRADIDLRDVSIRQLQEIIERDRARVAAEMSIAVANRELASAHALMGRKA